MIEFLRNIIVWIQEHQEGITTIVTSSTFTGIVALIINYIKNRNTLTNNTLTLQDVKASFKAVTQNEEALNILTSSMSSLKKYVEDTLDKERSNNEELVRLEKDLNNKINAMLEVQSIVYSTIKDDALRNSVNAILTMAKHVDELDKVQLEKEVTELRYKLHKTVQDVSTVINKTSELAAIDQGADPVKEESHTETSRY